MSMMLRVEAPGARQGMLPSGGTPLKDRPPGYFTSTRSAVVSLLILAGVLVLLGLDLVAPLLG